MYNPYMFNSQQQFNQFTLPAQQVIQVDGVQSANNIRMAPNSSIIVADKTLPMIYMCMTDGLGNVSVTAYDIQAHVDAPPVDVKSIETRIEEVETNVEKRLTEVEAAIARMEEKNGKPVDTRNNAKPNSTN